MCKITTVLLTFDCFVKIKKATSKLKMSSTFFGQKIWLCNFRFIMTDRKLKVNGLRGLIWERKSLGLGTLNTEYVKECNVMHTVPCLRLFELGDASLVFMS